MADIQNQYRPDVVSPPGETLQELLESVGMTQAELAERTGRPKKTINEIVKGKAAITPETALQLERVLGVPASFWNNRERLYREHLAAQAEATELERHLGWLSRFPVTELVRRRWIQRAPRPVEQLRELLNFFAVASPEQWEAMAVAKVALYRRSEGSHPEALAAWLRRGEIEAQGVATGPFDRKPFGATLDRVRALTRDPPESFRPRLTEACAQVGVAVVFVPEIPGCKVSGATHWMNGKAIIQLSLRYKTDDHLWFTFFHEAAHILLHERSEIFLETDAPMSDARESEADRFAADLLIPPAAYEAFTRGGAPDTSEALGEAIRDFAATLGIAPGIVVGRLQHDRRLPFNRCNELKQRFVWQPDAEPETK